MITRPLVKAFSFLPPLISTSTLVIFLPPPHHLSCTPPPHARLAPIYQPPPALRCNLLPPSSGISLPCPPRLGRNPDWTDTDTDPYFLGSHRPRLRLLFDSTSFLGPLLHAARTCIVSVSYFHIRIWFL
ncbi:hypothetical protein C8R47DRAFT_298516 [Mycena vitilis]|nr:hypothetical protein C8R47DRAFT_298516 [Mycena vitilis]